MQIRFGFEIEIDCAKPVPMLAALSTHAAAEGRMLGEDRVRAEPDIPLHAYIDGFGNRVTRLVAPGGPLRLWSDCVVAIEGAPDAFEPGARQHPVEELPDEALVYLLPSRYCDSDNLTTMAWERFSGHPAGWMRVQAVCDYVHAQITFGYKFGRPNKMASEVNFEKTGVCRDFAHLAISLCRALNIPARYASGYLGDIGAPDSGPGDFCAWFEVYLGGRWFTFDARYNERRIGRILMVRGRDAADVAMIMSFGAYDLRYFRVWTDLLEGERDAGAVRRLLAARPEGEAIVFPDAAAPG
ncbi:transglutaminase family protein [Pikeienuella sp. HZG-20]|uniref:transglutaminase-like domain-containing protein n=1 Tax=Paludibacillus litoralis TaxID=3133267 RepID=UPI0030EB7691